MTADYHQTGRRLKVGNGSKETTTNSVARPPVDNTTRKRGKTTTERQLAPPERGKSTPTPEEGIRVAGRKSHRTAPEAA